jgi:hypothetical protein
MAGEEEMVGTGVTTGDGEAAGTEAVGIVRVQAVTAIDPIPISNLKYLTFNLINYRS